MGLEAVRAEYQPTLDDFVMGKLNPKQEATQALKGPLDWDRHWPYPIERYAPVFEVCRALGLPLVALGTNAKDLKTVEASGLAGLDDKAWARLSLPEGPDALADRVKIGTTYASTLWKSKFYGAPVLNRRVVLHAIDATLARWRCDAGSSPLDRASAAVHADDLVKIPHGDANTVTSTQVLRARGAAARLRALRLHDRGALLRGRRRRPQRGRILCARLVTDASMAARAAAVGRRVAAARRDDRRARRRGARRVRGRGGVALRRARAAARRGCS